MRAKRSSLPRAASLTRDWSPWHVDPPRESQEPSRGWWSSVTNFSSPCPKGGVARGTHEGVTTRYSRSRLVVYGKLLAQRQGQAALERRGHEGRRQRRDSVG